MNMETTCESLYRQQTRVRIEPRILEPKVAVHITVPSGNSGQQSPF